MFETAAMDQSLESGSFSCYRSATPEWGNAEAVQALGLLVERGAALDLSEEEMVNLAMAYMEWGLPE